MQLVVGRDLVVRSVAFQACFLSAAAVAARFGAAALAAHQVVLQVWTFLALVLDSLAIAAQSLVGAALGAGEPTHAKRIAWRVTGYSALAALLLAAGLAAGAGVIPSVFSADRDVLASISVPWWFLRAQLPIAGIVFALDGGTATALSALTGFLPLIWLSLVFDWGLAGIWAGLSAFIVLRLLFGAWRAVSVGRAGDRREIAYLI